jgi:ribosomal protein L11 methyltransferase
MTGMFESNQQTEKLYHDLLKMLPDHQSATARRSVLEDQNWERVHLQQFKPIRCAHNLWIVPSWLQPPDPEAIVIQLDPGLAFGTGSHPTTALCLAWMADKNFSNQSVIDYGCGSGILSIAACKLGANRVFGVDIDPQAIDASLENSRRNGISQDLLRVSLVSDLNVDKVDLLIANILSGPLVELAQKFADMIKPGGKILLSGILKTQVNDIKCAYQSCFNLDPKRTREDWVMISGTRQHE